MTDLLSFSVPIPEYFIEAVSQQVFENIQSKILPPKQNPNNGHRSRKQTARELDISLPTLHKITKSGLLNSYKIGRRVLYKADEIEAFINSRKTNWK